jgi:hypothetical protein
MRTALTLAVLAAAATLLAAPRVAAAYPITPHPLRKLVQGADAIVVAKVAAVEKIERKKDDWSSAVAVLAVEEILAANAAAKEAGVEVGRELRISYPATLVCPAPPEYVAGTTALVFLARDEKRGTLTTFALSYGAKEVSDPETRAAYVARVREMLEIEAEADPAAKRRRTVEWLVRCAEDPRTRWDGAYELARDGDFMSSYDPTPKPAFARELDPAQRERLVLAVVNATDLDDQGALCLVDLATRLGEKRIVPRLRAELERLAAAEGRLGWRVPSLMLSIADLEAWTDGGRLARDLDALDFENDRERRALLRRFLAELAERTGPR